MPWLYIAGSNSFNNEVVAECLSRHTHLPCRSVEITQLADLCSLEPERRTLFFLDCLSIRDQQSVNAVRIDCILQNRQCKVICFNLDPKNNLDKKALKQGVDGVIYRHQPVFLYVKAVKAVLDGELWYPRRILEEELLETDLPLPVPQPKRDLLTTREREILVLLTSGMKNTDIAAKLCISPYTVKTHIYNLYKKTHVVNRFEAARWLSENS